jgi:uncharacterized protein YdhG (YjbR/CyaY superfamily)
MAKGGATTVAGYLSELPTERRAAVAKVRGIIRKRLPKGYRESLNSGMICYAVPLSAYPDTYNAQPLCYVALAAQKKHLALYLMPVYMNPKLQRQLTAGFARVGKRLDMGKSCVRFRSAEDLPLGVIGDIVASTPMAKFIAIAKSVKRR